MPVLLSQLRLLALSAAFCVVWFNAAVSMPAEVLSALKKTVLVLHGERLSIPAMRTMEEGLMAGLSHGQPQDLEIFSEYLDVAHFTPAQVRDDLVRYLCAGHTPRKLDVVIAVGSDRGWEFRAETGACTPRRALCRRADCLCERGPS